MDEKLSLLVSHILDRQGYSEEMRQYRIQKFNDRNFVDNLCSHRVLYQHIVAGSKAEGTSRHDESDYDNLYVYSGVQTTESEDIVEGDSDLRLYMETDTAPAGYCRLQLLQCGRDNLWHQVFLSKDCYVTCPGYCRYHLSSTFVASFEHNSNPGDNTLCGPASKGQYPGMVEADIVPAVRCSHFPTCFKLWFSRHTQAAWPSKQLMQQIAKTDVFLVPVGKHGSTYQFLEWRLSFNLAEKVLIQNFTTVQYKVYILLKKVMKEVIQPQCLTSVTSYIVKTLMLWAVEQIPVVLWRNDQLLNILVYMTERLQRCVQCGVCSMYFIPEDNILEGRINEDTQQIVSDVLSSLLDNGCLCILKVPSIARQIYQFMYAIVPVPLYDHYKGTEWEKTIILLNDVRKIHVHSLQITDRNTLLSCLQKQVKIPYKELLTDLVSQLSLPAVSERQKMVKYFVSQTLSQLALQQCVDAINQDGSNIQKYTSVRQSVRISHVCCRASVLCGRVRLAQVLYILGQYKAALDVLTVGAGKVRYYMTKLSSRVMIQKPVCHPRLETAIGNECLSTTQVLKYYSVMDLMFDHLMELCLPKALKYEVYKSCDGSRKTVRTDSETLMYFLQFLCYTEQRRFADAAFKNLVSLATSQESNIEYREVALNVLGHLLLKKGLYHQAARVLFKSIMVSKLPIYSHCSDLQKNAAVWHLAILLNKQQRQ